MLPDRSISIGQKLVGNAKLKNSNATFWVIFKHCALTDHLEVGKEIRQNEEHNSISENHGKKLWERFPPFLFRSLNFKAKLLKIGLNGVYAWTQFSHFFLLCLFIRMNYNCLIIWKLLKMSQLNFWILAFSANFCPIKIDLSGNTDWPQASGFQKLAKLSIFGDF